MIETLGEDLLAAFANTRLIDPYDLYQHLMTYWTETMQDDVYMIISEGWKANAELIPEPLVIRRYFAAKQKAIEKLQAEQEAIVQKMEDLSEEHGGEGGPLEEAKNDKGKITKGNIKARLKDTEGDDEAQEEINLLTAYLALIEAESEASKKVKDAQKALAENVAGKYKELSEAEVKTLVVDDKWLSALAVDVQSELDRISQTLTARIKELAERYAAPLPRQTQTVEELTGKVDAHLQKMGFAWQ